jgi:hypothetical protein
MQKIRVLVLGLVILLTAGYSICLGDYSIDWYTVDGGGGTSGGGIRLIGTRSTVVAGRAAGASMHSPAQSVSRTQAK